MADGGSLLQYRALDDRGEELLDAVEQETATGSDRKGDGVREYYLPQPGSGERGIEPVLDRLAPDWQQHVARITPR